MSDTSRDLWSRLLGRQDGDSTNNLTGTAHGSETPLSNIPGYFPSGEEAARGPNSRENRFNSVAIGESIQGVGNWLNYLVIKPIIILLIVFGRILAKLMDILFFNDKHSIRARSLSNTTANNNLINDPIDRVNKFVRALEDNLTPEQQFSQNHSVNSLPPFFQGSYTQALYMAHQRAKFLFVYLTHPQNENSISMFDKIITNQEFVRLFNDNKELIIWGGDLTNPEAYQLANSLNVTKFPFLGLLCLTRSTTMSPQGPIKTSPKISLILKLQGSVSDSQDPHDIINNKFKRRMNKYNDELKLIRNELREKFTSQVMLKQQDINYQNSLIQDRLKKKAKEYEKLKKQYLAWIAPKFKAFQNSSPETARVAIKFPDGNRVILYFPAENSVEDIFTYVELHNGEYFDKEIVNNISDDEAEERFKEFKLVYTFQLQSPLPPKRVLNEFLRDGVKVKDVDFIYPSGLLLFQENE